jgi:Ni/Co efflux regulator RcnB
MKTSTNQARNFRPTISKIVMALAVASVIGGMAITPALGQNNESRARAAQDRGRNSDRNQNDNRNRNDRRDQRAYRPAYQHPYRYSQPVYAPPPVYYDPQPSPGISLVFPLDIRF